MANSRKDSGVPPIAFLSTASNIRSQMPLRLVLTVFGQAKFSLSKSQGEIFCFPHLSPEISAALVKGFVEEQGCVLLASEAHNAAHTRLGDCFDETGYECFINHVHFGGVQEALEFVQRLTKALAERFTDTFAVIISFDGRDATVRFHKVRTGQPWLTGNLEEYREEGIAVFDSH